MRVGTETVGDLEFGDEYRLVWRNGDDGLVGEVVNLATDGYHRRVVPIRLDDKYMSGIRMRLVVQRHENAQPDIVVSSVFMSIPIELREAAIWHEVGHVHHLHVLDESVPVGQRERRRARLDAIAAGSIPATEQEADGFAVSRVGVDAVRAFLEYTLTTRILGGWTGSLGPDLDPGCQELRMRIQRLTDLGRNDPCPCGSGKKYKHCCLR
ncbi:MAG: hypothetical protein EG823_01000 [Actinobacteria bacterium]|nr:hypothetical protein [Actinomycetota bacterium]